MAKTPRKRSIEEETQYKYPVGTKLKKRFDTGWFEGTVVENAYEMGTGRLLNKVKYEDDDEEDLYNDDFDRGTVILVEDPARMVVTPEQEFSSGIPEVISFSERAPSLDAFVSSETTTTPPEVVSSSSNNAPEVVSSVEAIVSSMQAINQVLTDVTQDIKIKKEGCGSSLSAEERENRRLALEKWLKANKDPKTGLGRYVFRRGCAKKCLTTVLGGSGVDPFALVGRPPPFRGVENPFVTAGDFYVAGNEAFNPYGPRFPGDIGCVNTEAFTRNPQQSEFHLFIQCADKPHKRFWHGRDAVGGRMYVGVYRKMYDDDELVSGVTFRSNDLDISNKQSIAEYFVAKNLGQCWLEERHYTMAKAARGDDAAEWEKKSEKQRDCDAMFEYLYEMNYTMEIAPVEFVRYDEKLYQTLVDIDAVISRKNQSGRASLNAGALHQYY